MACHFSFQLSANIKIVSFLPNLLSYFQPTHNVYLYIFKCHPIIVKIHIFTKRGNISRPLKQMKNGKLKVLFGRLKNHLAG